MNTVLDKQHAHELIERLEESQVVRVVRFLEFMMLDPVFPFPRYSPDS